MALPCTEAPFSPTSQNKLWFWYTLWQSEDTAIESSYIHGCRRFSILRRVWLSKSLRKDTKIRIFNACVNSVLLYGCETWLVTKEIQRKIQTFVNRCLRYTGCNRRNGPDFGIVFLRSNYTDITQNTYIQSWTVTEIMAREKSGLLWCLRTVLVGDEILPPTWTEFLCYR